MIKGDKLYRPQREITYIGNIGSCVDRVPVLSVQYITMLSLFNYADIL